MAELRILLGALAWAIGASAAADFSWIRGVNYIPSTATWDFFTADVWDAALVERELGYAHDLGLNALRVRASPTAHAAGPSAFAGNMATFLGLAKDRNMTVLPVLFDTGDLLKYDADLDAYFAALTSNGTFSPPFDAILGFDVCNECYFTNASDGREDALRAMVRRVGSLTKPHGKITTTGLGNMGTWPHELDQLGMPGMDVVAFHSYNGNQTSFDRSISSLGRWAGLAKLPLGFASEVGNRPWDPLCGDIAVLRRHGLGFFVWELMQSQSGWLKPRCDGCPPYQGLLTPNGSAVVAEEVACIRDAARPLSAQEVQWVPAASAVGGGQLVTTPPVFLPASRWNIVSAGEHILPWQDKAMRGQLDAELAVGADSGHTAGANATVLLRFTGARVTMWFTAQPGGAKLLVAVDGRSTGRIVDTSAPTVLVSASATLAEGLAPRSEHELLLTVQQDRTAVLAREGNRHGGMHNNTMQLAINGFDVWAR